MSHPVISALFRFPLALPTIPYNHLLRQTADRYPTCPAIIFHDLTLTYRDVVSQVNSIASGMIRLELSIGMYSRSA